MAQKRFHGLKKIKIRATWNKYNLYNLSRSLRAPNYLAKTFYQQKWSAKSDMRAYHGEYIREGQWERMFSPHLNAVVQMDHKYLAEHDGSELAAGRGSGKEVPIGSKASKQGLKRLPYQNMTFAPIERRLDMAIFRALFASSAKQARQLVVHGAVKVNGHKMPYPGYLLNPGDMFQVDIDRVLFATGAIKSEEQAAQGRSIRSKEKNVAKELLQDTSPVEIRRQEVEKKRALMREEKMKKGEILEEPKEKTYEPISVFEDSKDTRDEIKFQLERYGLRRIALRMGKAGSGQSWRLTDKEKKERREHMTKIKIFNGKRHNIPFEEFKETAKKLFIRANALSLNVKARTVPSETLDLLSLKEGEELAKATVPKRIVKAIVGKTLIDLREKTGCRIRIPFDWEKGPRTGTQTLTLLGTPEATTQAKALIEEFVERNPEGPPPSVSEKSVCLNCSEPGHHWRGCAQPLTDTIEAFEMRDQKLQAARFEREKANRTCMNCKQPGHISSDCTQPKTEATIKALALRDQKHQNAKRADTSRHMINNREQISKSEPRAVNLTAQKPATPAEKRASEASGTSKYALKKAAELQEALAKQMEKEDENPVNALKAYATPWQPRPYMSPFAFVPRYLEVHHAIASAVYLRHPVVRHGLAEVPTPFSPETNQLAFNWYLRRR